MRVSTRRATAWRLRLGAQGLLLAVAAAGCRAEERPLPAEPAWPCTHDDPYSPTFRMTDLVVTEPENLSNPLIEALLRDLVRSFRLLLLLDLDVVGDTFRVGSGLPSAIAPEDVDAFCRVRWSADYPATTVPLGGDGDRLRTAEPASAVDLPVYSSLGADRVDYLLPLRLVEVELVLPRRSEMIGEPNEWPEDDLEFHSWRAGRCETGGQLCSSRDDCTEGGECVPLATLSAWIPVEESRRVIIHDWAGREVDVTLSWLLAGAWTLEGPEPVSCDVPVDEWVA